MKREHLGRGAEEAECTGVVTGRQEGPAAERSRVTRGSAHRTGGARRPWRTGPPGFEGLRRPPTPSGDSNGLTWIPGDRRRQKIGVQVMYVGDETEILRKPYNLSPSDRRLGSREKKARV